MATAIQKLEPQRTMHLRGFDRRGAAAAMHTASASAWTLSGVMRDSADFAKAVWFDADDFFGHQSWSYLPDFDFAGIKLQFDAQYTNLQAFDSPFFPSLPWDVLQVIKTDGTTVNLKLFDRAMLQSGTFGVASGSFTFQDNGIAAFDRVTRWYPVKNLAFDHIVPNPPGADPLGAAINAIRDAAQATDGCRGGRALVDANAQEHQERGVQRILRLLRFP